MEDPSPEDIIAGHQAFRQNEPRDAMYRTAAFLVKHFWGQPAEMANGLGVLLLTWNGAFYRGDVFSLDRLEQCISANMELLKQYRNKEISSYETSRDGDNIKHLFIELLEATRIVSGKRNGYRSAVSAAKALHLLAPNFFPLWDMKIAVKYECDYQTKPVALQAEVYLLFFLKTKALAEKLQGFVNTQELGITLPKLIDEYNYAKYTKEWL
jgi:hypothetical protein